ncbi:hypothetical protein RJ639_032061 [Escallonia herrerae]|uniref:RNase H type-1 domain-containing protein n=1 Tax=Escallonia herrerae TaxID=1293975 RepID=A0AA88X169_9ASTE|nr:hypothetical protein RJ639_032061 [Escallonia herrerae]
MVVASPSTHHSHLDPRDLRLRLTCRSSYGHKYRSTADPTYNPKEKSGDHITKSGSCYRRDPSVEDSTNSSPELVARAETPRRSTHRKRVPESRPIEKIHSTQRRVATDTPGGGRKRRSRGACRDNQYHIWRISRGRIVGKVSQSIRQRSVHNEPKPKQETEDCIRTCDLFFNEDLKDVKTPHDDPLVITIKAGNFEVKRVLVDNGSSAEIIFYDAFKKMNIPTDRLRKMDSPLYGFSNHSVAVEGIIALPVVIRTPPTQANLMLDFVVVKVPSAYNAILRRPALNQLQAVVSTYHLKMKFPTENGIEEVKGDQTTAHEDKTVRIGLNLKEDTKLELVNLLRAYADVFAWTAADMPGIDREKSKSQTLFDELKTYLISPPLLSKPFPREDLFLYLSVTEVAVSAILVREGDGVQKPIYYVSKVLQDVETRYPKIDRIALALITSAKHLRPYFQSHSIIIITDQPLRKVLLSPEASGRGPPQLVISEVTDPWNLYVDGSSAIGSSGARIILISPEGFTIEYALRFGFQASNNEADYEAFLAGIRLAHALRVDSLSVHSDSQLVVNHVQGDYEARDERMAQYLELVKTSAVKFKNFTIQQIPQDKNTQADALSRLASADATDVRRSVYLEFLKDHSISS